MRSLRSGVLPLTVAAAAGTLHAGFSAYWGLGGTWLLETLGTAVVTAFAGVRWLLMAVAAVKLAAAVIPLVVIARGGPLLRVVRIVSWAGAAILLLWGGAGMIVAQLVLAGAIDAGQAHDRMGMIGHAWLWDPLFVLWGAALIAGLLRTRCSPQAAVRALDRRGSLGHWRG